MQPLIWLLNQHGHYKSLTLFPINFSNPYIQCWWGLKYSGLTQMNCQQCGPKKCSKRQADMLVLHPLLHGKGKHFSLPWVTWQQSQWVFSVLCHLQRKPAWEMGMGSIITAGSQPHLLHFLTHSPIGLPSPESRTPSSTSCLPSPQPQTSMLAKLRQHKCPSLCCHRSWTLQTSVYSRDIFPYFLPQKLDAASTGWHIFLCVALSRGGTNKFLESLDCTLN